MDEYLKLFIMVVLLVISMIFLIYYDTLSSIVFSFIMLIICAFMVTYFY